MNDTTCSRCGLRPKDIRRIARPSPYAMYFNDVPLHQHPSTTSSTRAELRSFIRDAENELLDCEADIARVGNALRLLKQERHAGESFIAQHKSLLSPVHVLPHEIMLEIFHHCLDGNLPVLDRPGYSLLGPGPYTPWTLSAVCRRWRNILRQSPSYWSSFAAGQKLQPLQHALELSRSSPLHFILDLDLEGDLCTQALMKHVSRWETVSISGPRDAFVGLGDPGRLPMLTKLCISLEATESEDFSDPDEIMDFTTALSPFSDCPQLHELLVTAKEGIWANQGVLQTDSLLIPWSNLSKLTVSLGQSYSSIIRSLLLVCGNLRQLNVETVEDYHDDIDAPAEPLLIHSGITSLTLENTSYLLRHTEYSALTHLSISGTPQDFLPFLSRHCRNISHIELDIGLFAASFGAEDWDLVLPLLPDVVHLTARLYYPLDNGLSCISDVLSKIMGPSLRTLTIRTHRHLLDFCERTDIIPVIQSRWSARQLQILEIYSVRKMDSDLFRLNKLVRNLPKPGIESAVSRMLEDSAMVKALRGLKEEGLEVNINDIPLSDKPATLYM